MAEVAVVRLPPVAPLLELSDALCAALRERCDVAGYTDDVIAEMDGIAPGLFGRDVQPIVHHVLTRRGDAAAGLARVFGYQDALEESLVRDILGDQLVDALLAVGILRPDDAGGGSVRCPFQLRPFGGLLILADDATLGPDAVMPPAGTTRLLTQVMPSKIEGSVLDVGCGPGSLALAAAQRGAREVVATDINPRAIDMARFNARLNGMPQAEFLVGDLVQPVAERRFDLVVSQPPFIIQPPDLTPVAFLHGGHRGEELSLRLVGELPAVMASAGRALVLFEGLAQPDEPLHSRLRASLGEAPVDLLVLAAPGAPPAIQVIAYATIEAPDGGPAYVAAARRYLEHLDRLKATDFQLGLIVLRARPAGDAGRRKLAATVPVASIGRGDAAALDRLLSAVDLAALDDASLERHAVRTSQHVRWLEERPRPDPSLEPMRSAHFRPGSFGSTVELNERRFAMSAILDEAGTICLAVETCAAFSDQSSPDSLRREVLGFVREGLMRGLFEPRAD